MQFTPDKQCFQFADDSDRVFGSLAVIDAANAVYVDFDDEEPEEQTVLNWVRLEDEFLIVTARGWVTV